MGAFYTMNIKELLLIKLMEECAEVQQICAKALRFGTDESYDCDSGTNLQRLREELLDVFAVLDKLDVSKVMEYPEFKDQELDNRIKRIDKYMQYSADLGILE